MQPVFQVQFEAPARRAVILALVQPLRDVCSERHEAARMIVEQMIGVGVDMHF